mmetsp:Transcript_22194/g.51855  ORF Transcript_22194/g.51855 Transcript_22194/m.51855 type:complete len:313 (+) Transcript_22194:59-997(+)
MAAVALARAAEHRLHEGQLKEPCSPVDGARVAAALLRLGKLGQPEEEVLVIEAGDERQVRCRMPLHELEPPPRPRGEENVSAEGPVVESDLVLEETGDEPLCRELPPSCAPGSTRGRRLMMARARQCVVCMEEKEHTLVPPHREEVGQHTDSHRFCTDCWQEFLQHGLHRSRSALPPPLSCPLCRGAIDVPDVWGVVMDLPDTWMQASSSNAPSEASPAAVSTSIWGRPPVESQSFWADAAPGHTPLLLEEECSPMAQSRADGQRQRMSASRWHALSCPVPTWHTGNYLRRLYDALAGATVVQRAGLTAEGP